MTSQDRNDRIFLFVCGLLSFLHVQIVGFIPVAELVFMASVFFVFVRNYNVYRNSFIRITILLWVLWFVALIISDLVRESSSYQFLRGWSKVGFFGLALIVFYPFLYRNPSNIKWYILGLLPSTIISLFAFKSGVIEISETYRGFTRNWDSYYSLPFFVCVMVVSSWFFRTRPIFTILLISAAGIASIVLGSRSAGAILILGALATAYFTLTNRLSGPHRKPLTLGRLIFLSILLFVAAIGTLSAYSYAAEEGWLGERARTKYEMQAYSDIGMILSGRLNVVVAVLAIRDSPWIGYGSWPEDRKGYWLRAMELDQSTINRPAPEQGGMPRIMAHSQLFEAWVEAGILGGAFWIFVIIILLRFALQHLHQRVELLAISSLLLASFAWTIFFSPLGNRPSTAAYLIFFVALSDLHLRNKSRRRLPPGSPAGRQAELRRPGRPRAHPSGLGPRPYGPGGRLGPPPPAISPAPGQGA